MQSTLESERPPINQTPIHVKQGEFADVVASMGSDAYNQRFTVSLDGSGEAATQSVEDLPKPEVTEAQEPKKRVGINYVPGEPPLEAFVTGSVPDPNRPGQLLFSVIPANPEDAEGFPKVAPQEALVPSRIEMEELRRNLDAVPEAKSDESDVDEQIEQQHHDESIVDARAGVEAAYAAIPPQGEASASQESATETKSEVDKATEALDALGVGLSDKDISALKQYAIGSYASKSHEMTSADKKMSYTIINNNELKREYAKAWARLMDARKAEESQ